MTARRRPSGTDAAARAERLERALRDGPSEAELDAALRQLSDAPLPVGFVARTVEEATGWPRFRIRPRDLTLPLTAGATTALVVGAALRAADGAGPLWLRRLSLWLLSLWSELTPLPPPSAPVLLLLASAAAMLITAAFVLGAPPIGVERSGE